MISMLIPVHTRKASARNGNVSIVLRLLHKFPRVNRLLALAFCACVLCLRFVLAFCACVLCLRFVLAFCACACACFTNFPV